MTAAVEAVVGEADAGSAPSALGAQTMRRLNQAIADCVAGLKKLQKDDGHWVFELEADATIPSEYVLLHHFLGETDEAIERQGRDQRIERRVGAIVEAQVTAEGECYDEEGLLRLLRLARIGCDQIFAAQLKAAGR